MNKLTHFDGAGNAAMVDVTAKPETARTASARGTVVMRPETLVMIQVGGSAKGDVLGVARLAGVMAAKRTSDIIPLCHPLELTSVTIDFAADTQRSAVDIIATCKVVGRTGVEMEALTAVSVAALTIFDMCKAIDRTITLTDIQITHKSGGKSGNFIRSQ